MGTTTLVCHSAGTVPDFHVTLKRHFNQDGPTMSRTFSSSGQISSAPGTMLPTSFLSALVTSTRDMSETSLESSNSASSTDDMLVGFRCSSEFSFHRLTISPFRVSSSPSLLSTAWAFSSWVVWWFARGYGELYLQSLLKLLPHLSICIGDHQSHIPPCLPVPTGDSWAKQARKASFNFNLIASFTTFVHQQVLRLLHLWP